ncbi:hypothetical protein SELMODRAFT_406236 [Selaginella moellendorffii]|uniref:Uncharacterized protein n=1 Tax=Selaginella moellendorffii TaxID=88036 RepID=D8R1Q3_SELML|nr:hypothetical protein SELMODRAFT_406236 [Selaginella moellendorffii]
MAAKNKIKILISRSYCARSTQVKRKCKLHIGAFILMSSHHEHTFGSQEVEKLAYVALGEVFKGCRLCEANTLIYSCNARTGVSSGFNDEPKMAGLSIKGMSITLQGLQPYVPELEDFGKSPSGKYNLCPDATRGICKR